MNKGAVFTGKAFRQLLSDVTKFPSVGTYAGSELINLNVKNGLGVAKSQGLVLAWSEVPADGQLMCSANERVLSSYASLCSDKAKVRINQEGDEILLHTKVRSVKTAVGSSYQPLKKPATDGDVLEITAELGEKIRYLSDVAFDSASRQELCCVMLAYGSPATSKADGEAYALACNQKVVACMKVGAIGQSKIRTAIPLLLARSLNRGDKLYSGAKESVMSSGTSLYSVPSPAKAQADFPLDTIFAYGTLARSRSAACEGEKLGVAVGECNTVLAAKTDVRLILNVTADGIEIKGRSGTVEYSSKVPTIGEKLTPMEFSAPLDAMIPVVPLLTGRLILSSGPHGELFLSTGGSGWIMFSNYTRK